MLTAYINAFINAKAHWVLRDNVLDWHADAFFSQFYYAETTADCFISIMDQRMMDGYDKWLDANDIPDVEDQLEANRWDDYSDYIANGGWDTDRS